ncbi:hypothetical protein [Pseudoalteromonas rubra]|uniref:Uncharacterized protein n=1 Tax=Pseudoalteromonas rubra TaxID=43658 RepID=A0A0F4QMV7_9GAMM|nr:hypothetical protein [Pseudoalteromonas rubra]KJZ07967.1 hypothetical protein TW77_14025 [Pseudoalteromonas rubra]
MSSTDNKSMEQRISELQQTNSELVSANNALTATVTGKMGEINTALNEARTEVTSKLAQASNTVNSYVSDARQEMPFIRLTKNQFGHLTTDGKLADHTINPNVDISFEEYRTIETDIPWASRDDEEKEILTAMGMAGYRHMKPAPIRIIKMRWQDLVVDPEKEAYAFYQIIHGSNKVTVACYAKLLSGSAYGNGFNGLTNEWGLCGNHYGGNPGAYVHSHPILNSPSGEVLFAWYGAVAGFAPLDRNNPKWGYFPHIASAHGEDISV